MNFFECLTVNVLGVIEIKKIIRGLFSLIFLYCAGIIINFFIVEPYLYNKSNNEIKTIYKESKFAEILKINDDIKAWICINNTSINYPVLYSADKSDFYLRHNYKKEKSRRASIFMDPVCVNTVNSKNIILHGHHMRDGSMFADLIKFSDIDFYKEHSIVEFETNEGMSFWKIFAIFKTNTLKKHGKLFNYLVSEFENDEEFLKFLQEIKMRSLIDVSIDINKNDKLMTLSTCSYEFPEFRTVVVARKIRENESRSFEEAQNAKLAPNPLMPKCWYE